jgi:hypothetical protein
MPTIDALRAARDEHAKQIEAVNWLTVNDLAALGYLLFGASRQRRYDPRDVETFEREQKQADEARAS